MYHEFVPHLALRPFVDRLWIRTTRDGARDPVHVLPDGCIDIIFDGVRGEASVVGPMTRSLVFAPSVPMRFVGVRFRPGGAFPLLRLPADSLTDRACAYGDIGARTFVLPDLEEHADPAQAARRLEQALLAKLRDVTQPEARVQYVVQSLFSASPPPIDALARHIGWSRQHLARTLRVHVGVGAKHLARTARLHRAIALMHRQPRATLAAAAAALGYFDQAHMAADFRELVGIAPHRVLQAPGSIFPIRSLFESA